MATRRKFIKNTVVGAVLIYSGSLLSDLKERFTKDKSSIQEIRQEEILQVFSDDSIENRFTDNFFDKI